MSNNRSHEYYELQSVRERRVQPLEFGPPRNFARADVHMRVLRVAIHPGTFLRRQQIRDLRWVALLLSIGNPNDIMCARLTWKRWPSLKCPAVVLSNDNDSTSQAVSSTTRCAGLRITRASRISRTRKLRTSRGGHAALRRALRQSVAGRIIGGLHSGAIVPATRARVPARAFHVPSRRDLA